MHEVAFLALRDATNDDVRGGDCVKAMFINGDVLDDPPVLEVVERSLRADVAAEASRAHNRPVPPADVEVRRFSPDDLRATVERHRRLVDPGFPDPEFGDHLTALVGHWHHPLRPPARPVHEPAAAET